MKFHPYFLKRRQEISRKDIRNEWIVRVMTNPIREEVQTDGRIRKWGWIEEEERYLRVVVLSDNETLFSAFFDRRFRPQ